MGSLDRALAVGMLVGALISVPMAAGARQEPEIIRAHTVEIEAGSGASVVFDGRHYSGPIRVSGHGSGMAVVEEVSIDDYLSGIQEVPFSWDMAALQAQAIAARTYLAWTLSRGRTQTQRRLDYDICATSACQVYAGQEAGLTPSGLRWLDAVQSTADEILVYDGAPAATYYSSTSGGRTRTASDIWPDVDLPYLQAVASPGEESSFADWSWRLPQQAMQKVLLEAGLAEGDLEAMTTHVTEDGQGPWTVGITSTGKEETLSTWDLRSYLNRAGPSALRGVLPALRPDGKPYPQVILSPSYTISSVGVPLPGVAGATGTTIYQVDGHGWGHLVGMSQYGAQAMAERGAGPDEILAHYYGGLKPQVRPDLLPATVEVALTTGAGQAGFAVTGPTTVVIDGQEVATDELGSWSFVADAGSVVVAAPTGLGLPPQLRPGLIGLENGGLVVRIELTAAARVQWTLDVAGQKVAEFGPANLDAGFVSVPVPLRGGKVHMEVRASNRHGGDGLVFDFPGHS